MLPCVICGYGKAARSFLYECNSICILKKEHIACVSVLEVIERGVSDTCVQYSCGVRGQPRISVPGAIRLVADAESFTGLEFANLAGLADRSARDPPIFSSPALGL